MAPLLTGELPSAADLEQEMRAALSSRRSLQSAITFRSDAEASIVKEAGAAEWTNALLNLILELGQSRGFHVYPRRLYFARDRRAINTKYDRPVRMDDVGEYILDASWTRYPRTLQWVQSLRSPRAGPAEPALVLACEAEWASTRYGRCEPPDHVAAVLDDFAKLTDVRAARKIFIFSFQPGHTGGIADFDDIVQLCRRAVGTPASDEEYLLFGWPYDAEWPDRLSLLRSVILAPGETR